VVLDVRPWRPLREQEVTELTEKPLSSPFSLFAPVEFSCSLRSVRPLREQEVTELTEKISFHLRSLCLLLVEFS
jgi:hypothetical protein